VWSACRLCRRRTCRSRQQEALRCPVILVMISFEVYSTHTSICMKKPVLKVKETPCVPVSAFHFLLTPKIQFQKLSTLASLKKEILNHTGST
jgi:hypothetical protein